MELHGRPRSVTWTQLSRKASAGSNLIYLQEQVDWQVGEQIVISTTSYQALQTEVFTIASIQNGSAVTLNGSLAYDHLAFSETLPSGESYEIAAAVGLLTRNIQIVGKEYPNQFADLYGFRILVSDFSAYVNTDGVDVPVYQKGYTRLSNVEFIHAGQYSRFTLDDTKYGLLISNQGDYNSMRPVYVDSCSFHHGFYSAIGIFGSNSIPITNNVFHYTLDRALDIQGNSNIIRNNLVVLNRWSSSLVTKNAPFDKEFPGAIDVHQADSAVVEDNFIAGVERIGLLYRGAACADETVGANLMNSISGNTIYGSMFGVVILAFYTPFNLDCIQMSGFTVYKAFSAGIYYQWSSNVIVSSNVLVDNQMNIFTQVFGPPALTHISENKYMQIENNLLVGTSPGFNCNDVVDQSSVNMQFGSTGLGYTTLSGGKIGLVWSNFLSGSNNAPVKPLLVLCILFQRI